MFASTELSYQSLSRLTKTQDFLTKTFEPLIKRGVFARQKLSFDIFDRYGPLSPDEASDGDAHRAGERVMARLVQKGQVKIDDYRIGRTKV